RQVSVNMSTRPIRVLLIDDFEPWRKSVSKILQSRAGTTIAGEAADGIEAVRKAQELKPDLILLDIGLPGIDGLDAGRTIKRLVPDTHIIFLSQCDEAEV